MSAVAYQFADPRALLTVPNGAVRGEITADDMAVGERFSACGCPIGHALARLFDVPAWCITVGNGDVQVRDNNGRLIRWWRMDERGRGWRVMWDAGQRNQEPAAFELVPQPVRFMDVAAILTMPEAVAA